METQSQYRRDKLGRYCVPTHCLPNKPEPTLTFVLYGLGPYESTLHDIEENNCFPASYPFERKEKLFGFTNCGPRLSNYGLFS